MRLKRLLFSGARKLDTYRGEASLLTWFCTFCRHGIAWWYDLDQVNADRLPAFHRLDVRIGRTFRMFGRRTSLFADIQNIYNHQSVIEYSWDQKTGGLFAEKQLGILPVVGVNVEL